MKLRNDGFVLIRFQATIATVKQYALLETGFCAAKVVKAFGVNLFISDALWSKNL
jgi:hypothetical protein